MFLSSISMVNFFALGGIFLSASLFLAYSKRHAIVSPNISNYLLANQKVNAADFSGTFTASSVSLGGNYLFFITCHQKYGYLMLIGPMMYVLTQFLLLLVVKNLAKRKLEYSTFPDIWYLIFPSVKIARGLAIIAAAGSILAFFMEVHVGSVILSILLPNTAMFKTLSFACIGLVVLAYAYKGGYGAVVKTDVWQTTLMVTSSLILVYFGIQIPAKTPLDSTTNIFSTLFSFGAKTDLTLWVFISWAIIINVCSCLTQVIVWQRMSAITSPQEALNGLYRGSWKFVVVLWAPVMSFMLLYAKGYDFNSLEQLFQLLATNNGVITYIIYPLVVVGFAAALFSSADTNLIATIYSICDKNTFAPKLKKMTQEGRHKEIKNYLTWVYCFIIILTTGLHYLLQSEVRKWFLPIMYALWSVITMTAPLAAYALYRLNANMPALNITQKQENRMIQFIGLGLSVILIGIVTGISTGRELYSQIATLTALSITAVGLFLAVSHPSRRRFFSRNPFFQSEIIE